MPPPFFTNNMENNMTNKERIEKSTDRVKVTIASLELHRDDDGLSDIDYESIYKLLDSALHSLSNGINTWSSPRVGKSNRVHAAHEITQAYILLSSAFPRTNQNNHSILYSTWEALEALIA